MRKITFTIFIFSILFASKNNVTVAGRTKVLSINQAESGFETLEFDKLGFNDLVIS